MAYGQAHDLILRATAPVNFDEMIVPLLIDGWLTRYRTAEPNAEVIRTETKGHSYLFDVPNTRLLAAWSVVAERAPRSRDTSRMRDLSQPHGEAYHRGHAIAHTLGGGEDINLLPQLGRLNIGRFRKLERKAVKHIGSLYFTFWIYRSTGDQIAMRVEQGLLVPGDGLELTIHDNLAGPDTT
jgi:hypothetical protein